MIKHIKINFAELYDPMQILHIVKHANFRNYVYCFIDDQERVLKYGVQHSANKQLGERVYRQAVNLDGWNKPQPYSSNGMSIKRIAKDYESVYHKKLSRNNVSVLLWDQTNDTMSTSEMRAKCLNVEGDLISKHINQFGCAPIGNNEKATKRKVSAHAHKSVVSELFE
jgi:hypothetical protein